MNVRDDRNLNVIQEYDKLVKRKSPPSKSVRNLFRAFWVGGLICVIGQFVAWCGEFCFHLDQEGVAAFTAIVMVFLGATLTGIGVYDRIGKYAGAGSVVPITGFANSVVAPAIEYKKEGIVLGTGAKLFAIAGPVLVNGISASVVVGIVYWVWKLVAK